MSKPSENNKNAEDDAIQIQLTTFRNWQEIGNWWAALAEGQAEVTPAIQAKAKELTAGLTTDLDKARAIYLYVSLKFRYISISLGAGQYRPHSAAEVIANQYGDCKDKHALRRLVESRWYPGVARVDRRWYKVRRERPHRRRSLITSSRYFRKTANMCGWIPPPRWRHLAFSARVSVTSRHWSSAERKADPAENASRSTVSQRQQLRCEGVTDSRRHVQWTVSIFDLRAMSLFRCAPHSVASRVQWPALAQQLSRFLGFGGDVSDVDVENLQDLDKLLHCSYEYARKNYSDWANHQIAIPLLPLGFAVDCGNVQGASRGRRVHHRSVSNFKSSTSIHEGSREAMLRVQSG